MSFLLKAHIDGHLNIIYRRFCIIPKFQDPQHPATPEHPVLVVHRLAGDGNTHRRERVRMDTDINQISRSVVRTSLRAALIEGKKPQIAPINRGNAMTASMAAKYKRNANVSALQVDRERREAKQ